MKEVIDTVYQLSDTTFVVNTVNIVSKNATYSILNAQNILTLFIVLIAFLALRWQNKNFKKNIEINKLEEIYLLVQETSFFYSKLMEVYNNVEKYKDANNKSIKTLNEFYQERDKLMIKEDFIKLFDNTYKIELFAKAYTEKKITIKLLYFTHIMLPLLDVTYNGGSIKHTTYWKNGFPDYSSFFKLQKNIEDNLISKININKNITSEQLEKEVLKFKEKQDARK